MMHRWVVRGAQRFELPGAQQGRDHLGGRLIWDTHLRKWLVEFLGVVFGGKTLDAVAVNYGRRGVSPS